MSNPNTVFAKTMASAAIALMATVGLIAPSLDAAPPKSGDPKATFIKGDVTAGPDAAAQKKVKRNQPIPAGSTLKTGEGAHD